MKRLDPIGQAAFILKIFSKMQAAIAPLNLSWGNVLVDKHFPRWYIFVREYLPKQIGKELKSMIVREVVAS